MKHASISVGVFGLYLLLVGAAAVGFPAVVAEIAGIQSADDLAVRLIGGFLAVLAYYYLRAADMGDSIFFRQSVYVRVPGGIFLLLLWAWGIGSINFALFALVVTLSGVWTYIALRPAAEEAAVSTPRHA